ncbi:hypothetical protein ACHHYP_15213 [Achlya hypogyna]|uniref:Uncharacterized protein n=1 Tax=Achlya hypogyna TaxID=1202772 RepID=A0A1V9YB86_ACHHY|nr:hypothetical protein ACHHYP_15213 [Achlya hypogyna]
MALYRSLEADVTAFFIAQGTIFETVVNSLCVRVHQLEQAREASAVESATASLETRVARLEHLVLTLSQDLHGLQDDARGTSSSLSRLTGVAGVVETALATLTEQVATHSAFLETYPMQITADSVQKVTLGWTAAEVDVLSKELQRLHEALARGDSPSTADLCTSLDEVRDDLALIAETYGILDKAHVVDRLRRSLAALGASMSVARLSEAAVLNPDERPQNDDDWQSVLSRWNSVVLPTALSNLRAGSIAKELDQQETPMTPLALYQELAEKVHKLLQATGNQQESCDTRMQALTTELHELQDHERQLEGQLATFPRREDVLQQLELLQDKIARETTSTSQTTAALDDLRNQFQTLPTADMVTQLQLTLKSKADKADLARLQREKYEQSTMGLSKVPLKCLSCDQFLPCNKLAPSDTWHSPAPVVSPRNTVSLRPLDAARKERGMLGSPVAATKTGTALHRPTSSTSYRKTFTPQVEFVDNVVVKLEKHRPLSAAPRGYTLQSTSFEMEMPRSGLRLAPPTAQKPASLLSDKQRYSFYYFGDNNAS